MAGRGLSKACQIFQASMLASPHVDRRCLQTCEDNEKLSCCIHNNCNLDLVLSQHFNSLEWHCCRSQVEVSQVMHTTSTATRTGPNDIHVGDVLHVTLETTETPFGDPSVIVDPPRNPDHFNIAKDELKSALEQGYPVMGRILNSLIGGYAVGVGGIVGFCPFRHCTLPVASRLGVLQPFYVIALRDTPFNLVLRDANMTDSEATKQQAQEHASSNKARRFHKHSPQVTAQNTSS